MRSDLYSNLTDYFNANNQNDSVVNLGRRIVLSSSFIGSPRNVYQIYLDAMCTVQHYDKPSVLIAMAYDSSWPEIVSRIVKNDL